MRSCTFNLPGPAHARRSGDRSRAKIAGAILLAIMLSPLSPLGGQPAKAQTDGSHDISIPAPDRIGPDVPLASLGGLPTTPPPDPQVGDSWVWWL